MCVRLFMYMFSMLACLYMCTTYVREVFYLGLLSVYSLCVCVNIRVVWSGFGPPDMGMQNLSTFQ